MCENLCDRSGLQTIVQDPLYIAEQLLATSRHSQTMGDGGSEVPESTPAEVLEQEASKLTQSQRAGGKKRKVAVFVAFVGAGYSVR